MYNRTMGWKLEGEHRTAEQRALEEFTERATPQAPTYAQTALERLQPRSS